MSRWNSRRIPQWDQLVCPQCQNDLDLQQDDVNEGEIVSCSNCGSEFEVMTRPFELRRTEDPGPLPGIHRAAA
jgi:alpha-aminoadipate/glutamate carrier protein LysW